MVDHFIAQVAGKQKIGGKARAMIVCNGIARAIDYWREVSDYLTQIKSPYKAIVAYSGDFEIGGQKKTEADLNGFPSKDIPANLKQDPYRFLIVANKFVTGFDEPLLHTMYVDKPLAGVLAVQTLSRLNRAHPQKHDTFVLDFADNAEAVKAAFQDYYRATIQTGETDANKLHDLKAELDGQQVYSWQQVEDLVALYLSGADRDKLDPILDACVIEYTDKLGEDDQVKFKGKAKAFVRSYGFLAAILSYGHPTWEKLSIFLNFLIPKLPAPKEEDLSKGVLETIDMDSYRVEAKAALKMAMDDADATVDPVPPGGGGGKGEPEIDKLSNDHQDLQRPVRQHRVEGRGQDPQGHHRGDPGTCGAGQGLPERAGELRQAERQAGARQGAQPRGAGAAVRPHRTVQAVQRQPHLLQALADGPIGAALIGEAAIADFLFLRKNGISNFEWV
jgi:type I restriction enzyme R subunit